MRSFNPEHEKHALEQIAQDSWYSTGVAAKTVEYCATVFARHLDGRSCLELGPAEGLMTSHLRRLFEQVTAVDGSDHFCEALRTRLPDITVVHSLFEDYEPDGRFDAIVLGHVLEHVADPPKLLRRIAGWLNPDGVICSAVPNARSLHRQAGVLLGMLQHEAELNETDLHHGHRRVYDPESFRAEFTKAGLPIILFGGYWIKTMSNRQLDETCSSEVLNAFFKLGERYPDIAAEIYVIAGRAE